MLSDMKVYNQVSDRGRIKSICSYVRLQNGELMKKKPHILKLQDRCGYKCVNLFKGGHSHTLNIHRLVAEAFLPNPHRYSVVNHKDETKAITACLIWNGVLTLII